MISEQAKIKREELVEAYDYSHLSEKQSYKDGFDAGYEFAKSEAVEEIKTALEKLKKDLADDLIKFAEKGFKDGFEACEKHYMSKIATLEAIIQKLEDGLRFYGKKENWIETEHCEWADTFKPTDNHKDEPCGPSGETARSTLASVQAMKEGMK